MPTVPPEELAKQLGGYLRKWRDDNGVTLQVAAERIGLDLQQWHRWESGRANPTLKNLLLIAQAMDKELPELIADVWHFRA